MGDEYPATVPADFTVHDLMIYVEEQRGISRHRQQLRQVYNKKLLQEERYGWLLKRHNLVNKAKIIIEPTRPEGWIWDSIKSYNDKHLAAIVSVLQQRGGLMVCLEELQTLVSPPPCIKDSMRVFLRLYPQIVFLRADVTSNKVS